MRGCRVAYFTPGRVGLWGPGLGVLCLFVCLLVCLFVCFSGCSRVGRQPPALGDPPWATLAQGHLGANMFSDFVFVFF